MGCNRSSEVVAVCLPGPEGSLICLQRVAVAVLGPSTWCVFGHASGCVEFWLGLVAAWWLHHSDGGPVWLLALQTWHGQKAAELGTSSATLCPS